MQPLLTARDVDLHTPDGRPIVRNLNLQMGAEQAVIVGRNGIGKSTLLRVLAGIDAPTRGLVTRTDRLAWVPQDPPQVEGSRGERRATALQAAFAEQPDLLLLDEPSEGLDAPGRDHLLRSLTGWRRGLLVVSHDPAILASFDTFWTLSEAGCSLFSGSYEDYLAHERQQRRDDNARAARAQRHLARREAHHDRVQRRRARKKAVGRVHELDRNQSKSRLNTRKSLAQVSQAKVAARQQDRLDAERRWTRALTDALARPLPLDLVVPAPTSRERPAIAIDGVPLPQGPTTRALRSDRIVLTGPNGSGKTTLLEHLLGHPPRNGRSRIAGTVRIEPASIGSIAQGARDWARPDSLIQILARHLPLEDVANHIVAHGFPIGLAERPLETLSPGERVRAALIVLFTRDLELLALDEPAASLDPVARQALTDALRTWTGGLLVATHDDTLLQALNPAELWTL